MIDGQVLPPEYLHSYVQAGASSLTYPRSPHSQMEMGGLRQSFQQHSQPMIETFPQAFGSTAAVSFQQQMPLIQFQNGYMPHDFDDLDDESDTDFVPRNCCGAIEMDHSTEEKADRLTGIFNVRCFVQKLSWACMVALAISAAMLCYAAAYTMADGDFQTYGSLAWGSWWGSFMAWYTFFLVIGVLTIVATVCAALCIPWQEYDTGSSHREAFIFIGMGAMGAFVMIASLITVYFCNVHAREPVVNATNLVCQDKSAWNCESQNSTTARGSVSTASDERPDGGIVGVAKWYLTSNLVPGPQSVCERVQYLCEPPFGFDVATGCVCNGLYAAAPTTTLTTSTSTTSTSTTSSTTSTTTSITNTTTTASDTSSTMTNTTTTDTTTTVTNTTTTDTQTSDTITTKSSITKTSTTITTTTSVSTVTRTGTTGTTSTKTTTSVLWGTFTWTSSHRRAVSGGPSSTTAAQSADTTVAATAAQETTTSAAQNSATTVAAATTQATTASIASGGSATPAPTAAQGADAVATEDTGAADAAGEGAATQRRLQGTAAVSDGPAAVPWVTTLDSPAGDLALRDLRSRLLEEPKVAAANDEQGAPAGPSLDVEGAFEQLNSRRLIPNAPAPWEHQQGAYCDYWSKPEPAGWEQVIRYPWDQPWCFVNDKMQCAEAANSTVQPYQTIDGVGMTRSNGPCTSYVDSYSRPVDSGYQATFGALWPLGVTAFLALLAAGSCALRLLVLPRPIPKPPPVQGPDPKTLRMMFAEAEMEVEQVVDDHTPEDIRLRLYGLHQVAHHGPAWGRRKDGFPVQGGNKPVGTGKNAEWEQKKYGAWKVWSDNTSKGPRPQQEEAMEKYIRELEKYKKDKDDVDEDSENDCRMS